MCFVFVKMQELTRAKFYHFDIRIFFLNLLEETSTMWSYRCETDKHRGNIDLIGRKGEVNFKTEFSKLTKFQIHPFAVLDNS